MAIVHEATVTPSKLELLTPWLVRQPWAGVAEAAKLSIDSSYRFDDPAGQVGVEVLLIKVPGSGIDTRLVQVPVSFRGAPLAGGDSALIGTLEHSVLGKRWVYDGVQDPVFAAEAVRAIVDSGESARVVLRAKDGAETEVTNRVAHAYGTGLPTGAERHPGGAAPGALPVVQEVEDTALISVSGHRLSVARHPEAASDSALDAPSGQLRVELPGGGSVLAARLLD